VWKPNPSKASPPPNPLPASQARKEGAYQFFLCCEVCICNKSPSHSGGDTGGDSVRNLSNRSY